jgi:hypothetical protein
MNDRLINLDDLRNVSGIGKKTFETIEEEVEIIDNGEDDVELVNEDFHLVMPRAILQFMHDRWYEYLKEKHSVSRLWSYSRMSTFTNSKYEYYLKYIKHANPDKTGVYLVIGSSVHDLLEKYYIENWSIDKFKQEWIDALDQIDILDLRFHGDDEKNDKRKGKYIKQVKHYGKNFIPETGNIIPELPIELVLDVDGEKEVFVGFIDLIKVEEIDGKVHYTIRDYKTSTKFSGKKMRENAKQLYLYTQAIMDMYDVPVEQVHIDYDFLKYVNITFRQKNGKIKTTQSSRHQVVNKIANDATRRMINDFDYDIDETDKIMSECYNDNSFDPLPDEIREIYSISNGIVKVPLDKEILSDTIEEVRDIIREIKLHEKEYVRLKSEGSSENELEMVFWDDPEDVANNIFYFSVLCSYYKKHKPWIKYQQEQKMFLDESGKDGNNGNLDLDLDLDDILNELNEL